MTLKELIDSISPATFINLKRAVEIGKWPDGEALSREQRELSMQAVIAWEEQHLPEAERSGFIEASCSSRSNDSAAGTSLDNALDNNADAINIRWLQ